ncbi:MAG: trimethylamine methyltransferase family protein [Planctomycetota bacterium]|nr:trimethylamine methyltransferase family protein [Planctomycetota bacterium]
MTRARHERPGQSASLYRPLSDTDVKRIADAALQVLETSGMAVYADTAFEALRDAGAPADEETRTVRFPRSLVEDAVASNPSSITLHSRDGENDVVLEGTRVHYGTGGTALYVLDPDRGHRREANISDLVLNARLIDALENVHLHTINVFPHDVGDTDDIDVNRFYHSLNHTTKHIMGGVYSLAGTKKVIEMARMIAGGSEALRQRPFVSFITLIISPFKIDDRYGEMTCYLAREGLPVVVPTEPICGTTSPVTLAGNVLTHVAETLGGIAMVQAVHKGASGICGSVGSISDLKTMNHLGGPIERAMINAAVAQVAQYFKLPLYSTGGTTDAKDMNAQGAYESAMSSLLVAMSGANYIHDAAGLMEADLTVSYEKLVVDNEILGMCQRVLRGIEVNDDTLATDLIIEKGPGKDYLVEDHTIRHMRGEFYMPDLANRQKREDDMGLEDAVSKAKIFVHRIRKSRPESRLGEKVRRQILMKFPEILLGHVRSLRGSRGFRGAARRALAGTAAWE